MTTTEATAKIQELARKYCTRVPAKRTVQAFGSVHVFNWGVRSRNWTWADINHFMAEWKAKYPKSSAG